MQKKTFPRIKNFAVTLFILYCLTLFILFLVYAGFPFSSLPYTLLLVIAAIFLLIATLTITTAVFDRKHPFLSLLAVSIYPLAASGALAVFFEIPKETVYLLPGYIVFMCSVAGFLFGILLAPFLTPSADGKQKRRHLIRDGLRKCKAMGLRLYGTLLFIGIFIALGVYSVSLADRLLPLSAQSTAVFLLLLGSGIVYVALISARQTVFNKKD